MKVFSLRRKHDNAIRKLIMRLLSFHLIWDDSTVYYHINTLLCNFCSCVQFLFLEIVDIICLHSWDQCLGCSGKLVVGTQLQLWKHSTSLHKGAESCERKGWLEAGPGTAVRSNSHLQPSHSRQILYTAFWE